MYCLLLWKHRMVIPKVLNLLPSQESPPVGNRKWRTTCGVTCPSITFHGRWGVPYPVRARGEYPILSWLGYPPPRKDMGPVEVLWDGDGVLSPQRDSGPVEVLWDGDGVPPLPCGQTDIPKYKYYLPLVLRTRAVKTIKFVRSEIVTNLLSTLTEDYPILTGSCLKGN